MMRNLLRLKKIYIFLILLAVLLVGAVNTSFAQSPYTSVVSGNWNSDATWSGTGIPGVGDIVNINHNITIDYGEVYTVNSITINGKLTVNGTLTINEDLSTDVDGEFIMGPNAVVIVKGDVLLGNKCLIDLSSYFIILGNFIKSGADNQGSITAFSAHIYIMGHIDAPTYFTVCDQYSGTTTDTTTPTCDGGTFEALITTPIPIPIITDIIQQAIAENTTSIDNLTPVSSCFCTDGSVVLTIGDTTTPTGVSIVKWFQGTSLLTTEESPIKPYEYTVTQAGTYNALYKIGTTWYQTNTVNVTSTPTPTASISGTSTICNGTSATLSIALTGTGPWNFTYTDGTTPVTVIGQAASTYIVDVSPTLTKTYTLTSVSTDCCVGTISGSAIITVNMSNVSISSQSTDGQTRCIGANFNPISVAAAASMGSITGYQWYSNTTANNSGGSSISGATSSSYTPLATSPGTLYYYCIVTGTCGSATSAVSGAFITKPNPVITTQPIENSYCSGDNASFSVVATGSNLTYQWQTNYGGGSFQNLPEGSPYSGTSTSNLTISSVQKWMTDQNYKYRVVVSSDACPVISSEVRILVGQKPSIYNQPENKTICEGASTTFDVNSDGTAFQWELSTDGGLHWNNVTNNTLYSGATTRTLSIVNGTLDLNNYQYRVLVSINTCSLYSSVVSITVNPLPIISTNPIDLSYCTDNDALFSVLASGTGLTYQWQAHSGNWYNINDGSNYSNTNSSTLTVLKTQTWQNGYKFRVIVTNMFGCTVTSEEALLTVSSSTMPSTPSSIVGNNTPCQEEDGLTYTVTEQSGATFSWSLPLGWTITSGQGTNSIIVKAGDYGQDGTISVYSANSCGTSNASSLAVSVSQKLPVSVAIAASANPVCAGTSVTFTATPTNGGTSPSYQWKVNGTNVGSNSSTYSRILANGEIITCMLTSNETCTSGNPATSNSINITVDPASEGGSVSGGTTICSGSTSGQLTLSGQTGSVVKWQYLVSPFTDWTDIANAATSYISTALTQTTQFRAVVQSGSCSKAYSTPAEVIVGDLTAPDITQCLPPGGSFSCVGNIPAGKTSYQGFHEAGGAVTENCTDPNNLIVSFTDVIDPISGCKVVRTYTIKDDAGNQATCTQIFTITDTTKPVITCNADLVSSPNTNGCEATLTITSPTAISENCSLVNISPTYSYRLGDNPSATLVTGTGTFTATFPEGNTTISWVITDLCGNTSTPCTQNIHVVFNMTNIEYDSGSTEPGLGSGVQPMQTSTHDYFVDNKIPESGYIYSWGLYADNGGVPGAAIDPSLYTLSNVNQAHVQLAFKSNIPTNNYIISVIKTKNATTCTKQQTIQITVQSNSSFDVSIGSPGDQCQAPGINATTMIRWNINFPSVSTEPFRFNYEIKMDGTAVSSGAVSNIAYSAAIPLTPTSSGSLPYSQYSKSANSYTVVVQYTFYSATGLAGNHALEINISDITDAYQVSEPVITNNTDALQTYGVPVITFE